MAKKNVPTGQLTSPTVASDGAATSESAPKRPRKAPDSVLNWNKERDNALIELLLRYPRQLTRAQLIGQLKAHPAFAGETALDSPRAGEKVRLKVMKLATVAEELGVELGLKRSRSAGYDVSELVKAAVTRLGIVPKLPVPGAAPAAPVAAPAPAPLIQL